MNYPVLAPQDSWYYSGSPQLVRENFTSIQIVDSYVPTGEETLSWDGSAQLDGSITVYVLGTTLIIAGNGSGKIQLSEDASFMFNKKLITTGKFTNVTEIDGLSLIDVSQTTNPSYMFYECSSLVSLDLSSWQISSFETMQGMFLGCNQISSLNLTGWDTANVTNMSFTFGHFHVINNLDLTILDTHNVTTMAHMFMGSKVDGINMSTWNTSNVTTMAGMFQASTGTALVIPDWNTHNVTTMQGMFKYSKLSAVDATSLKMDNVNSCQEMFLACPSITSIHASNWDLRNVTTLRSMFSKCENLTDLDISGWLLRDVTTIEYCFFDCNHLTSLDISSWSTGNVTTFSSLFGNCYALAQLNVNGLDTSSVTDMTYLFQNCEALKSIDISTWNTQNVTDTLSMFVGCKALTSLDLSTLDLEAVTRTMYMFHGCSQLSQLDLGNWSLRNVNNATQMFMNCSALSSLDVSNIFPTGSAVTSLKAMFYGCQALSALNVSNWDVSNVIDMQWMFHMCYGLTTLNVSRWNVGNVQKMNNMFAGGGNSSPMNLTELDVSGWDTSSCDDMSFMFYSCSQLGTIDVSNWDVSKVTDFDHMFCHSHLNIDVSKWHTPAAVNMEAMFHTLNNTVIDVSNLDTRNVQFFCQMFERCVNLTHIIGLENFDTSNGLGFDEMFDECPSLRELNLSSFDTRKAKDGVVASSNGHLTKTLANMFTSATKLERVVLGEHFSMNGDGSTTKNKCVFPTPDAEYITYADGNWYNQVTEEAYSPSNIPSNVAASYCAVHPKYIADYNVKYSSLRNIADAVREITGETKEYYLSEIPEAITSAFGSSDYNTGVEDGKQAEKDDFWSKYMKNINEGGDANYLFAGSCWNSTTFYPKYDIVPKSLNYSSMFSYFSWEETPRIDLAQRLEECGVKLDFSQTTGSTSNLFAYCYVTRLPKLDLSHTTSQYDRTFRGARYLVTIDELILSSAVRSFNNTFQLCNSLTNLILRGLIGSTIDFSACTKLTKNSILGTVATEEQITAGENIITLNNVSYFGGIFGALSTTSTGQTLTLSKTAVNKAFATTSGGADGSTSQEWLNIVSYFSNWTISLL